MSFEKRPSGKHPPLKSGSPYDAPHVFGTWHVCPCFSFQGRELSPISLPSQNLAEFLKLTLFNECVLIMMVLSQPRGPTRGQMVLKMVRVKHNDNTYRLLIATGQAQCWAHYSRYMIELRSPPPGQHHPHLADARGHPHVRGGRGGDRLSVPTARPHPQSAFSVQSPTPPAKCILCPISRARSRGAFSLFCLVNVLFLYPCDWGLDPPPCMGAAGRMEGVSHARAGRKMRRLGRRHENG